MATANSLMALKAGARQIECTINAIGERAGNAGLEEVAMALVVRKEYFDNLYTNINTKEIYKTSRLLCRITSSFVQPNKAVVGDNAFAHESGIHQHGVLSNPMTYEIMKPEDVGFPSNRVVLGKHSGRHALKSRLQELGIELPEEEFEKLFEEFKALSDKKKYIYDEDIEALIYKDVLKQDNKSLKLISFQVQTGDNLLPTATVSLEINGEKKIFTATGDGPVDAVIKAIEKALPQEPKFLDYSIKALTPNTDAQAEARVLIELNDIKSSGSSTDTDIVKASANAFLDAVNKALFKKQVKEKAIEGV
jgi:2-isopropylmalate synthase